MKEVPIPPPPKPLLFRPSSEIDENRTWKYTDIRGLFRVLQSSQVSRRVFWQRYLPLSIVKLLLSLSQVFDPLFSPSLLRRKLNPPVFVVGVPRSGTTYLYHLLSSNPHFICPQTYETIFPSVNILRFIRWIGKFDEKAGGFLRRQVDTWLESEAKIYQGIHRLAWRQPEEDEQIFLYEWVSPSIVRYFPFEDFFWPASLLDDLPMPKRSVAMKAYIRAIRRIVHARQPRPEQTYLAKNVYASGRFQSMLECFPSARWVHIVRDPQDVIPSAMAMMMAPVHDLGLDITKKRALATTCVDLLAQFYRRLIRFESMVEPKNWVTIRFNDLIRNPTQNINSIYEHFDWPINEEIRQRLMDQIAIAHSHRSSRAAALSNFGLNWTDIRHCFLDIRQHYDFEDQALAAPNYSLGTIR